jgi:CO/xanthine dehydrogenase FAD-binding subunit
MKSFEYHSPQTVEEACAILTAVGANSKILAGGTDVLVGLRKPAENGPGTVVDISRIASLRGIEESGDSIVIRPLTTHTELLRSNLISSHAALLTMSVAGIGSPQIRNRGTVGGNIMNAAACADTVPPLIALGATITLQSGAGTRDLLLSDFFTKPYVTAALPGELLTGIRFAKLPPEAKSTFVKLGRRNALSISRLSVAAILAKGRSGLVTDARIVPGAALPRWQRVTEAESLLLGREPSLELFADAGRKVAEKMISYTGRRWSTEYKEPVIAVLVRRALEACS